MAKHTETIAEMLAHGSVVSWNMRNTPTRAHGKYTIRLELTFWTVPRRDGNMEDIQTSKAQLKTIGASD